MKNDYDVFRPFKFIGAAFGVWFLFCLFLGLAMLGAAGYAVYWGLTLAERAVEQGEHNSGPVLEPGELPTHQYVLPDAG